MRWERVRFKTKTRETLEGRKSPGRKGGTAGPGKRWGHTCNSVKNGRALYVFGGYGKDNRQTNDVHVFDTAKQTWSKPMVKGTPPSPRDSHSSTTVGASLYVFGGTDGKCPLQDLYILDTVTNTWSKPRVEGDGPAPREGHSAALIGHKLFIFGGCGKSTDDSEEIYYNDLHILDTVKLLWTRAITRGTAPTPRDSHTCSAWDNRFIVLGGEDASDSYLSDVHILDTDVMEWKELQTSGQKLMPRAGHATVSVGKHIFVFGGFTDDRNLFDDLHMLNIESGVWTMAITTGTGPSARFSVAGDCIDARSGTLVFIGGCNENLEALDDMYYLHTDLKSERGLDERPGKFSLRKELKRKREENQIVIKSPEEKEAPPVNDVKARITFNSVTPVSPAVGASADKFSLFEFKPVEEKVFEAKITDVFHYGYTIESNVDGKLLRGLLFSYKPGFAHAVHAYLTRKKLSTDTNSGKPREARKSKLKIARGAKHGENISDGLASEQANIGENLVTPSKQLASFPNQYQQFVQQHEQQQHQLQQQKQQRMTMGASVPTNVVKQDPRQFLSSGYTGLSLSPTEPSHHQVAGQPGIFAIRTLPSPAQVAGTQNQQQHSKEQTLQPDQQ